MKEIALQYFECWNNQDLNGLRSLFTKDVSLRDWELEVFGIDEVIKENAKIFSKVPNVRAEIQQIGTEQGVVFAQLIIHLNENENISVVDVIFIENNKISRIQAYKC